MTLVSKAVAPELAQKGSSDLGIHPRYPLLQRAGTPLFVPLHSPDHLADAILIGGAEAALAASIFHYRQFTIEETKRLMRARGVPVRLQNNGSQ